MTTILLVEDSAVDRTLVQGLLQREPAWLVRTAEDGADALASVSVSAPDVVITDLQMPNVNGLQLVAALRIHYPHVPVILITAHGSEELAVRALEQGAASYVPKSQVGERLASCVQQVLTHAHENRSYERLSGSMDYADFRFTLDNDPALFDRLIELVQEIALNMQLCDSGSQVRLGMALEEALRYMMLRGNLECGDDELAEINRRSQAGAEILRWKQTQPQFAARRLLVRCQLGQDEVRVVIIHQGPPFAAPPLADCGSELEAPAQRSLVLMRAFLDRVEFSSTGSEVLLIKRRAHG